MVRLHPPWRLGRAAQLPDSARGPALARALAWLGLVDAALVGIIAVVPGPPSVDLLVAGGGLAALLLAIAVFTIPHEWRPERAWLVILVSLLVIFVDQAAATGGASSPFVLLALLTAVPCSALLPARTAVVVVVACAVAYLVPLIFLPPRTGDLDAAAAGALVSLALVAGLYQGVGAVRRQASELNAVTERLGVVNAVLQSQLGEIERRERAQRALHRLASLGPGRGDAQAVWEALHQEARGLFGPDILHLWAVGGTPDEGGLVPAPGPRDRDGQPEPGALEDELREESDPLRLAVETRRTQYLAAVESTPIGWRRARALGVRSAAFVPLVGRERVVGVLVLAWRNVENPLPPDDLALCQTLARECGAVLEAIAMERAEDELQERIAALYEEVRALSLHDPLTGLHNRRFFDEIIERDLQRATRVAEPYAVLMADLDRFHAFNETYGHEAGDRALQAFASVLQTVLRGADTAIRFGGEEFLMLLPGADRAAASRVAARVRAATARLVIGLREGEGPAEPDTRRRARITVSIGYAVFPQDGSEAVDLVAAADRALYAAKHAGRDRVVAASRVA